MSRIALIHAVDIAIQPVKEAFEQDWPEATLIHLWDETLSIERAKTDDLTPFLYRRVEQLLDLAISSKVDAVMFTCSAFGEAIDEVAKKTDIPVLKPNQAMFELAITQEAQVALLGTFEPAMKGMELEFTRESDRIEGYSSLTSLCVPEARNALKAGNEQEHNQQLLQGALQLEDVDVIMLAHFSSSIAKPLIEQQTQKTVLSSPECAVSYLKQVLSR